jgi:adenylate cyclase
MEEAAKRSAQDSTPLMWRGVILLRAGYITEAIAALEEAQRMDPLAGINTGYLAIAYLSAGRKEDAEASARKALSQGWNPAMRVIVYDKAARGERERAVALWDELIAPQLAPEDTEEAASIREMLRDPAHTGSGITLRPDYGTFDFELTIAVRRYDLLLDQAEAVLRQDPEDRRRQWWLRSAWLPSTLTLREDPRFYAVADALGMVRMWQTRGWPDGCKPATSPSGDHLDCEAVAP